MAVLCVTQLYTISPRVQLSHVFACQTSPSVANKLYYLRRVLSLRKLAISSAKQFSRSLSLQLTLFLTVCN